jgi:hypothetical protein
MQQQIEPSPARIGRALLETVAALCSVHACGGFQRKKKELSE